jgi:hypothetical protein
MGLLLESRHFRDAATRYIGPHLIEATEMLTGAYSDPQNQYQGTRT